MLPINPALVPCCEAFSIVTPNGDLPPELFGDYLALVIADPQCELYGDWLRSLENDLGVNDAMRRAVESSSEAVRQSIRRDQHLRSQGERKRAERLNLPMAAPAPDGTMEKDLRDLGRLEEQVRLFREEADGHRDAAPRRTLEHKIALGKMRDALGEVKRLRRRIDAARQKQVDSRWASWAISETGALAHDRGEPLQDDETLVSDWKKDPETGALIREEGMPVLKTEVAKVRRNLDPILSLSREREDGKKPHLNEDQANAAERLRQIYAARREDLSGGDFTGLSSGRHDHEKFVAGRFTSAKARQIIHQVEMGILIGMARDEQGPWEIKAAEGFGAAGGPNRNVALRLIRAVCEQGHSLSSQGKGRAFEVNLIALKAGLNVAFEVFRGRPKKAA